MKIVTSLIIFVSFFISCAQSQEGLDKNWIKSVSKETFVSKDGKLSFIFDDKGTGIYQMLEFKENPLMTKDEANDFLADIKYEFVSSPEKNKAVYTATLSDEEGYIGYVMKGNKIYVVITNDEDSVENPDDLDWETLKQDDSSIYVKQ